MGKANKTPQNQKVTDPIAEESHPLIPSGEYDAICYRGDYKKCWRKGKDLYLNFRIIDGAYDGYELFMAINNPKKNASFRTKLFQQWALAMGHNPKKGEPLSKKAFLNKMFRILVRKTKRKHHDGSLMPEFTQYSVVDTILEPLTGIPINQEKVND